MRNLLILTAALAAACNNPDPAAETPAPADVSEPSNTSVPVDDTARISAFDSSESPLLKIENATHYFCLFHPVGAVPGPDHTGSFDILFGNHFDDPRGRAFVKYDGEILTLTPVGDARYHDGETTRLTPEGEDSPVFTVTLTETGSGMEYQEYDGVLSVEGQDQSVKMTGNCGI